MVHPEIIHPETGEPFEIKEGTQGELIYTSIDQECMPLMRFRTRDHVIVTKTECECGRTGFGIRCIGRTDDMLIIQGVNVYPSAVKDVVSSLVPKTTGAIEIQLKRRGEKGKDMWKRISWEQAVDEITDQIIEIHEQHGPLSFAASVNGWHYTLCCMLISRILQFIFTGDNHGTGKSD
jgi:phenylacetate-coenzyme A ligase PaaK-like adenylate-forming protein